jgi:hypothetical protein
MIEDMAAGDDVDEDELERATLRTRVHSTCGKVFEYEALDLMLWYNVFSGSPGPLPTIIALPDIHEASYRHYAASRICLIDAPLLSVMAAANEERRTLNEDVESGS